MTKRSKEMKRSKKVLLSMGVLTVVGALAGAGTFASFNAQTTNPGNVFATGTLVLSDKVDTGAVCYSTAGGVSSGNTNVNSNETLCDKSFNMTVAKPGDSFTSRLTIKNEGTIGASALKVFSGPCVASNAALENFRGTGDPCDKVQIYVQQYSDSGFLTPSACLYGGSLLSAGVTCDFSDALKTLGAFATGNGSLTNAIDAGPLTAGASRYFRIGVKLPTEADNTYQGRAATISLNWNAEQVLGTASGS